MRMLLKGWEELPEFMRNEDVKVYYESLSKKKISLFFKRIFDIVMSLIMIIITSPLLLLLSIWIKLDSKGPVFYRQARITQYGEIFHIYKFRTMIVNADKLGTLVTTKNDVRITKVGNKIRKCRLDEIPQLFNVLRGEMSFVGTRPEVKRYVDSYTDEMKATLLLPAGITSVASVKFKNEEDVIELVKNKYRNTDELYITEILPKKMSYNLKYLINYRFYKDIYCCLITVL
ncbi:sugar transferase [[Clostridium] innocuum]|uniref:Sugar transferase n=2 Tax=Clostridium innocuum TaxID=1522 RepID=A0A3E2VIE1_CLOIN|nr:sugar transferase [[Clostridium] innocuum]MCR0385074.1 sugar transferase [[Clostridium] innocuum]MCR0415533.1 sugar transferase [[Clostridium] innocuum]MCR0536735.1 sugar transferase [[Clostridium] innocuum]MCR0540796.1 sugar transferase [[Clostridium] innocuum]RGC10348.1 sugar transferase [[Clostridium] innocuum]